MEPSKQLTIPFLISRITSLRGDPTVCVVDCRQCYPLEAKATNEIYVWSQHATIHPRVSPLKKVWPSQAVNENKALYCSCKKKQIPSLHSLWRKTYHWVVVVERHCSTHNYFDGTSPSTRLLQAFLGTRQLLYHMRSKMDSRDIKVITSACAGFLLKVLIIGDCKTKKLSEDIQLYH